MYDRFFRADNLGDTVASVVWGLRLALSRYQPQIPLSLLCSARSPRRIGIALFGNTCLNRRLHAILQRIDRSGPTRIPRCGFEIMVMTWLPLNVRPRCGSQQKKKANLQHDKYLRPGANPEPMHLVTYNIRALKHSSLLLVHTFITKHGHRKRNESQRGRYGSTTQLNAIVQKIRERGQHRK